MSRTAAETRLPRGALTGRRGGTGERRDENPQPKAKGGSWVRDPPPWEGGDRARFGS